jgi:hypothetical protein
MINEEDLRLIVKRLYEFVGFEVILEKESSLELEGDFERLEKLFGDDE